MDISLPKNVNKYMKICKTGVLTSSCRKKNCPRMPSWHHLYYKSVYANLSETAIKVRIYSKTHLTAISQVRYWTIQGSNERVNVHIFLLQHCML